MSKSKSKNRNEVEYLKGIIKRLKAQLKYHKRHSQINDDIILEDNDFADCPSCGKGEMLVHDFFHVKFHKCNVCDFKEKLDGEK